MSVIAFETRYVWHLKVQDVLLEYGLDIVAEILIEGISRIKRCSDEGRALMSLDLQVSMSHSTDYFLLTALLTTSHLFISIMLFDDALIFFFFQVLINGLQHLVSANVKPKLQMVETFIKVTLIFKLLWTDENKLFVAYFKLDWLLCTVRTVFKVYNVLNLLMMHHQTGVLPPRNWICTLGTCSPGKKLTLNWEKLEIFMTCKTFKSPIRMPLF